MRATSRRPIWWISSGVQVGRGLLRHLDTRSASRPSGSAQTPTSVRPFGAYSSRTNAAKRCVRGDHVCSIAASTAVRMRSLSASENVSGNFFSGTANGDSSALRVGDALRLLGHFLEQELRRHQPRGHALAHVRDRVVEDLRELAEADDVVVVVLHGRERQQRRKLRGAEMDAAHLIHRHLPVLELRAVDASRRSRTIRSRLSFSCSEKRGRVDGLEALQELLRLGEVRARRPSRRRR